MKYIGKFNFTKAINYIKIKRKKENRLNWRALKEEVNKILEIEFSIPKQWISTQI